MSAPATMSGVQLVRHGGPEALVWNEAIPVPQPELGWALVKVLAAGVNNTDINTRVGWYAKEVTGATADTQDGVEAGGFAGAGRRHAQICARQAWPLGKIGQKRLRQIAI